MISSPFPPTKPQAAFCLSVDRLFSSCDKVYYWTFTFKNTLPDWGYAASWQGFTREMGHQHGRNFFCLRVIEAHPGGHGLHYHALLNRRLNIHMVERIGAQYGMGYCFVERATRESMWYLAKYLGKEGDRLFGVRKWWKIGPFCHVKWSDIQIESEFLNAYRQIRKGRKVSIGEYQLMQKVYDHKGFRAFLKCASLLERGQVLRACKILSPNHAISHKGGLLYRPPQSGKKLQYIRKSTGLPIPNNATVPKSNQPY